MNDPTHLYRQIFSLLSQHSQYRDLRHLKTLAWMVSALIGSQKLSLPAWESYVQSKAQKAQSYERRWKRFICNARISVVALYIPLVLAAMSGWSNGRVYLGLDTVSRARYNNAMESLLHDSYNRDLWGTSRAAVVESIGAQERISRVF